MGGHPPVCEVEVDLGRGPGISGMDVIARVHELDPQIVIVVITGYATIDTAVEAMKTGAYDFLPKPFSPGLPVVAGPEPSVMSYRFLPRLVNPAGFTNLAICRRPL